MYSSPSQIQKNTPVRRVGLSRKRKSSCFETQGNQSQSNSSYKSPLSTNCNLDHVESEDKGKRTFEVEETENVSNSCNNDMVELFKKKKLKKEEIKVTESVNSEIEELQNLCGVWKNGLKGALLHLLGLLKEKQPEFNSVEKVAVQLGIWDTVTEAFKEEPDFLAYEE